MSSSEQYVFKGMRLPSELRESIDRYVEDGVPTGGFLEACIDNDLRGAVERADDINIRLVPAVIGYLYNRCPAGCWGRPQSFKHWIERVGSHK